MLLTNTSSLTIEPCSANEEFDIISAWECYRIWLDDCGNTPDEPPLETYRATQKEIIDKAYKARIDQGYNTTTSDGTRVILGLTTEAQANLATAVLSANILYSNDTNAIMPTIYDINGQPLSLSYEQLIVLYKKYTSANSAILSLYSYLIAGIDAALSPEEVISYIWDLKIIEQAVSCPDCYSVDTFGECVPYVGPPDAPQDLVASALDSAAYLFWTTPKCDGEYVITNYVVQYSLDYGQSWINYPSLLGSDLFAIVTGLTNGLTYMFRVAAVNSSGTGPYSFASDVIVISGDDLYNKTRLLLSFE